VDDTHRSAAMTQPTDQPAPHQTLDALISEAFGATRDRPPPERCEELNRQLRAEIGHLHLAAREAQAGEEEYSRDWWRLRNVLLDTDYVLAEELKTGLSAAIHLGALARQAQALRAALDH
jgi:hypothetical protein